MPDNNTALVQRFFDEVCNKRQLNTADQLFSDRHVYHDPANPRIGAGPDGMKQLIGLYQQAFPDAHWQVDEMMSVGDTVVTRWTGSGTHKGALAGIAPTGRQVSVPGIWIHRVSAGKIAESWNAWHALGLMQQLGVVAAQGEAGAASR